ncbi:MAG: tetratricopeptide repeat protein, partial [Candidatus Obscuribacterales bacterium]|nr:tetratricopeptide repeat protein [Candidatus Obscuribacterales bacterium]
KIGTSFADVLQDYDEAAAQRARTGKLGELLMEAGIIKQQEFSQAMEQGLNTGMPLGRMLVLNQVISADFLEKALDIQIRLRDEMMSREEAIEKLRQLSGLTGNAPEEALKKPEKKVVRLGELLVMAGVLGEHDVMDALEWGLANQQPIGNVLVSQELISQELLDAALFFQTAVKDDKLDALKACECLSEVFSTGITPEEALSEVAPGLRTIEPEKPPIDYQTLLTMARVVSEEEIDQAFNITTHNAALIGKVLVLTGFIDVPTLQSTLRCFQMVAKGWLSPDDAIATLDYCLHHDPQAPLSFEQALRDLQWTPESGLKLRGEKAVLKNIAQPSSNVIGSGGLSGQFLSQENLEVEEVKPYEAIEREAGKPESVIEPEPVVEAEPEPVAEPEPEPVAEAEPIAEPEPADEKKPEDISELEAMDSDEELPITSLDGLLSGLDSKSNGEEQSESELHDDDDQSKGGLKALLIGLSGSPPEKEQSNDNDSSAAPGGSSPGKASKGFGGTLGSLVRKSPPSSDQKSSPETEAEEIDSSPAAQTEDSSASKADLAAQELVDELAGLSAIELLEQIVESTSQEHRSARGQKRAGRFSDTILPESAKAAQLAKLLGQESAKLAEKFDTQEAGDALGSAFGRLAESHFQQGNYKEAQVIYERILVHKLNDIGPDSLDLVEDYNNLAMTLCVQGLFDKAAPFMKRTVSLYETSDEPDAVALSDYLHSLGTIEYKLSRFEEAEETFKRVLEIRRETLPSNHPDIGKTLTDYARVVKKLGHTEQAETIYKKAQEILAEQSES